MTTVVIVIHLMVVLAMIGLVLLQRSEGGALGIGGGQGAFLSGRSAGNVLTRSTAILAVGFFVTSLGLALIAKYQARPSDILQSLPGQTAPVSDVPATQLPAGAGGQAPATAQELIQQLGGTAGPQPAPATTPTADAPATPAAEAPAATPAAAAPATEAPVATPAATAPAPPTDAAPATTPAAGAAPSPAPVQ